MKIVKIIYKAIISIRTGHLPRVMRVQVHIVTETSLFYH